MQEVGVRRPQPRLLLDHSFKIGLVLGLHAVIHRLRDFTLQPILPQGFELRLQFASLPREHLPAGCERIRLFPVGFQERIADELGERVVDLHRLDDRPEQGNEPILTEKRTLAALPTVRAVVVAVPLLRFGGVEVAAPSAADQTAERELALLQVRALRVLREIPNALLHDRLMGSGVELAPPPERAVVDRIGEHLVHLRQGNDATLAGAKPILLGPASHFIHGHPVGSPEETLPDELTAEGIGHDDLVPIQVTQGSDGRIEAAFGLLQHPFPRLFGEVLDVVSCHQGHDALLEPLARMGVGAKGHAFLDEVDLDRQILELGVVAHGAVQAVGLLDQDHERRVFPHELHHAGEALSAGFLRGFNVGELLDDPQTLMLRVRAQQV